MPAALSGVQRLGGGKGGGLGKVLALAGAQEELPLGQGGDGGAVQQARGQGGKGIVAQGQVVLGAAQPAGHVVPAGQADGPAEQLDAAVLDQPGRRVGHAVVLPVVKAAALAGERQHRHAPRAVDLELHVPAQGRAPFLIISAFHHDAVASFA